MGPILSFGTYSILSKVRHTAALDAARAFTALAVFQLFGQAIALWVDSILGAMAAIGSLERIREYLSTESHIDRRTHKEPPVQIDEASRPDRKSLYIELKHLRKVDNLPNAVEDCIILENASSGWTSLDDLVLRSLNFRVRYSTFTNIIGPVGCGKSTFLKTLLGEVPYTSGKIYLGAPEVAYCSQTPWLINDTIRQNIIGENVYEKTWYDSVVGACALEHDFDRISEGDRAMAGSKGIALSGGQRVRLVRISPDTGYLHNVMTVNCIQSLARAVYSRKEVMILDDVLSGLDATTEQSVFAGLFGPQGLLRQHRTTIIMVTSSVQHLAAADHIVVIGKVGRILEEGTFDRLNSRPGYVQSLFVQHKIVGPTSQSKADLTANASALGSLPGAEKRRVADLAVYKYYIDMIGWTNFVNYGSSGGQLQMQTVPIKS
ncbi:MAG: hypothetical protein M1818_002701 [Claussenomyces sp. TS43310]|nr:MAG: hypothetical protein M1818_002701 [Claussenomyces sp. TS43310]